MFLKMVLAGALALSGFISPSAPGPDLVPERAATNVVSSSAIDAYIASDAAKVVTVDPSTGEILSAVAAQPSAPAFSTFAAYHNNCTNNRPCWREANAPLVPYGFSGASTTGTWIGRGAFLTRGSEAKLCWLDPHWVGLPESNRPSVCMREWVGRNTEISVGFVVTGKAVYLR